VRDIWFTADTHFSHGNIMCYCNRPFGSTEEMEEVMVGNWNELVKPGDDVYHLGDFIYWRVAPKEMSRVFRALNGRKHLVIGNHDRPEIMKNLGWVWMRPQFGLNLGNEYVWLSHYAHRTWNRSFHGSWHLFGHSHGKLFPHGFSFDAGVDSWNFKPINLDTVWAMMRKLEKGETEETHKERTWNGLDIFASV